MQMSISPACSGVHVKLRERCDLWNSVSGGCDLFNGDIERPQTQISQ